MIEELTPVENLRATMRSETMNCLTEANHLASVMAHAYQALWTASPEIVLELLNSNVPHWLDVLQRNTAVGTTINAQLEAANLPQFPHRVPVTMPDGYAFDGTQFTYTEPEPEPDPEP